VVRQLARLTVAALVAATVGLGVPGPAQAATCSTAHGVTVVVDFHQLGGGIQTACDLGGAGKSGATQLVDVGHTLTYAQRQPGFVCRVDGSPSSDPCINTSPADAYWSLWWSDGTSGQWSFSSQGAGSLTVPDGGYVALSWQGGTSKAAPRVSPQAHPTASASPTASPSHPPVSPTGHPSSAPTTADPTAASSSPSTAPGTPSASPLGHHRTGGRHHHGQHGEHGQHGHHSVTPAPSATDRAAGAPRTDPVEPTGSGLPGWVAPGLVALVFAAAAAVVVVRRRRTGGS
jgi:hypothetical protein